MAAGAPYGDIPADMAAMLRVGTIASVDLAAARCTVRYGDPDDDDPGETPAIRWLSPRAGLTRIWSPPSVGEQVLLVAPDGQIGSAVAVCGIVCDAFPPLGSTKAEQIEFEDGARITYDPEAGALSAILPAGATAEIEAPGGMTLRGDVAIEGNVTIQGSLGASNDITSATDVLADGTSLAGHKHTGISSGTAVSGPPE